MDGARAAALDFELLAEAWLDWGGSRQRQPRSDKMVAKELSWIACVASEAGKLDDEAEEAQRQRAIFGRLKRVLHERVGPEAWDGERMPERVASEVEAELFGGPRLRLVVSQAMSGPLEASSGRGAARAKAYGEKKRLLTLARRQLLAPSASAGLVNDSLGMLRMLPGVVDDALAGMLALHERGALSAAAGAPSVPRASPKGRRM